jgi:8-oxo-dGTP pyrophosphatase MutT (NUDIX family)
VTLIDPQRLPVEGLGGEPALAGERLTPAFLRARLAAPPAWTPERPELPPGLHPAAVPAAVLVPLVTHASGLTVLLTERTAHLSSHAGQVSFPGGRAEPEDASLVATALRETEEEIGIAGADVEVLGTLPELVTVSGYRVLPVVGLVAPPLALRPDPREVARTFEVPLAWLMDGTHHERRVFRTALEGAEGEQVARRFYSMPYAGHFIWGATAAMLRNLYHLLRA